jgi:hypothetical protein
MKKHKLLKGIFLTLICTMLVFSFAAAASMTLTPAGPITAAPGSTVELTMNLVNSSLPIGSLTIDMTYDETILTYASSTIVGSPVESIMTVAGITDMTDLTGNPTTQGFIRFAMLNMSFPVPQTIPAGTTAWIVKITFTVNPTASGSTPVDFYSLGDLVNYTSTGSSVTVGGPPPSGSGSPAVDPCTVTPCPGKYGHYYDVSFPGTVLDLNFSNGWSGTQKMWGEARTANDVIGNVIGIIIGNTEVHIAVKYDAGGMRYYYVNKSSGSGSTWTVGADGEVVDPPAAAQLLGMTEECGQGATGAVAGNSGTGSFTTCRKGTSGDILNFDLVPAGSSVYLLNGLGNTGDVLAGRFQNGYMIIAMVYSSGSYTGALKLYGVLTSTYAGLYYAAMPNGNCVDMLVQDTAATLTACP